MNFDRNEQKAVVALLGASITIATELAKRPTAALKPARRIFTIMPIQLVRMICVLRSI